MQRKCQHLTLISLFPQAGIFFASIHGIVSYRIELIITQTEFRVFCNSHIPSCSIFQLFGPTLLYPYAFITGTVYCRKLNITPLSYSPGPLTKCTIRNYAIGIRKNNFTLLCSGCLSRNRSAGCQKQETKQHCQKDDSSPPVYRGFSHKKTPYLCLLIKS